MSKIDLQLTGVASLVFETTRGPMEVTLQDLKLVTAVLRLLVSEPGDFPVTAMHANASRSLKRRLRAVGGD